MIGKFFLSLAFLWLPQRELEPAARQAIEFYFWSLKLKVAAFLPGSDKTSRRWRMSQIKKQLRKMPALDNHFKKALRDLEIQYNHRITLSEFRILLAKREKVPSLVSFLRGIETEEHIATLRGLLMEVDIRPPQKKSKKFNS